MIRIVAKSVFVSIVITMASGGCTSPPEASHRYCSEDSVFLFTMFLNYDEQSDSFGDVDEPGVYDYWNENQQEAIHYFAIAAQMESVPAAQRMIFASYLVDVEENRYVRDILSGLKDDSQAADVYYIMDSYGLSFKKFNVSEAAVKKYCPDLVY